MKKRLMIGLLGGVLLVGCSKQSAEAPVEAAPVATTEEKGPDEGMLAAQLADMQAKIQAKQYDAAVGGLAAMKDFPKTAAEEAAYQTQLKETAAALAARAAAGDKSAQESQRTLGVFMLGR